MEGNFESSGAGSGGSVGDSQMGSPTSLNHEGFEVQENGVFGVEEVELDIQNEIGSDEVVAEEEWDLMDIPGTAHDKLSAFSEMSDEELDEFEGKSDKRENFVKPENEELTFEQKIIQIQAETLKLLAQSMNKEVDKKELEELIKKLKKLIEEPEGEKSSSKETLVNGALAATLVVLTIAEQGYKKLENEVQEAEK